MPEAVFDFVEVVDFLKLIYFLIDNESILSNYQISRVLYATTRKGRRHCILLKNYLRCAKLECWLNIDNGRYTDPRVVIAGRRYDLATIRIRQSLLRGRLSQRLSTSLSTL